MIFNLDFAYTTILSCFFFSFLIIDLYFLIPGASAQIFKPIAEFVILIRIPRKQAKPETEIYPVTAQIKKEHIQLKLYKLFCAFYLSFHFCAISSRISFFVSSIFLNLNS